jgi:hypothetical protein
MKEIYVSVVLGDKGPESFSYVHVLFRFIYLATASKSRKGWSSAVGRARAGHEKIPSVNKRERRSKIPLPKP